ncbi:hypothetical protein GN958_ATG17864, partial [Phytophthora infestans]
SSTLREHSRLVEDLKIYPDGPYERIVDRVRTRNYSDVKNYELQSRQFISRQRACDEDNPVDLFVRNWHRVQNWLKSTLKWCIEVLSCQCLRAQEHAANVPVDRFPVQHRRGVYLTSAYPTDLEEEDDDDWIMRSARGAASEIDWTTSETVLLSLPMASQVQSHGAWSTDEHE